MFDTFPAPDRSLHQEIPPGWPVLLGRAEPPACTDPCSTRRRDVLVAMADGSWQEAVAWAWSWNASGQPVQWRCQVEIGGHVSWYAYRAELIVTRHRARLGHVRGPGKDGQGRG